MLWRNGQGVDSLRLSSIYSYCSECLSGLSQQQKKKSDREKGHFTERRLMRGKNTHTHTNGGMKYQRRGERRERKMWRETKEREGKGRPT